MKKGVSIFHMIIFLAILLMVGLGYVYYIAFSEVVNFEKGVKETTVIEGTNIMELLRKNLQQALRYSYYQSSFEIAKVGGNVKLNDMPTWRKYEDIQGFPKDIKSILKDRTLEIFNKYSNSLNDEGVTTVEYTSLDAVKKDDGEYVSALAKDKKGQDEELQVSRAFFYHLYNKANTFILVPIRTLTLFEIGENNFVLSDKIQEKAIGGITSTNFKSNYNQKSQTSEGSTRKCGVNPSAEEVFTEVNNFGLEDGKKNIKTNIDLQLNSLEKELSTSTISTELLNREIQSDIVPVCAQTTEECCFPPLVSNILCIKHWKRATCTFSYFGAAKVKIAITDKGNKYPVYDSADKEPIAMRNIQLNFNIISGNDYSRKLVQ